MREEPCLVAIRTASSSELASRSTRPPETAPATRANAKRTREPVRAKATFKALNQSVAAFALGTVTEPDELVAHERLVPCPVAAALPAPVPPLGPPAPAVAPAALPPGPLAGTSAPLL